MSSVLAFRLSASPPELDFKTNVGELVCADLRLQSEESFQFFKVYDRWSLHGGKNLLSYSYKGEDFGIESRYQNSVVISEENNLSVCFKANKPGFYWGVLFLESEIADAGLGIWLKLDVNSHVTTLNENSQWAGTLSFMGLFETIFLGTLLAIVFLMHK